LIISGPVTGVILNLEDFLQVSGYEMSKETIQDLVNRLRQEIKVTPVDEDTRALMQQLDTELDELLDPEVDSTDSASVFDKAEQLEARFASEYPVAERVLREIVDMLTKMGV